MALNKIEGYKNLKASGNLELIIGRRCGFNGMVIQNDGSVKQVARATVRIGDNLHSGTNCIIRTSDHDFSRGYPMVNGHLAGYATGDVTIGDHVWIGNNVLIMKGVNIGDGAVIQAGSVVVSDVPPLAIAGGHPCRVFAYRCEEEYKFWLSLGLWKIRKEEVEIKKAEYEDKVSEFLSGRELQAVKNKTSRSERPSRDFRSELIAMRQRNVVLEKQIARAHKKVEKMARSPLGRLFFPNSLSNLIRVLEPRD